METDVVHTITALVEGVQGPLVVLIVASLVFLALSIGFAAVAIVGHLWAKARTRVQDRQEKTWRNGVLAVLAGARSPRSLTSAIDPADGEDFLSFLVPYATTVEGEEAERLRALAGPFMSSVRRQLKSKRALMRAQAVQRIGILGGAEHLEALRDALNDPSDRVVEMAVRRLAVLGGAEEADRILGVLGRLEHVDRRQVSSALVKLGDDAAPTLRSALADEERPTFVRVCCAETLRWLGDGAAASVAARLLREARPWSDDTDAELVASLLRLLRRVGRTVHADLVRSFCRAPVAFVRIHAARALGQLGTDADEALLVSLVWEDDSRWVALSAARSLLDLGRTGSLRDLRATDHARASLAMDLLPASA